MIEDNEVYPLLEPKEDKIYRLAEAVTSIVPAAQVVLHSLITPPVQKRMKLWIEHVENRLEKLESDGLIDFEELLHRESFSALVLRTIQSAAITSQKEKLLSLENFLVNIAKTPNIDEDELYILLGILTEFTPSHIKVLEFYSNPSLYSEKIKHVPTGSPPNNQAQGRELAVVFKQGDTEYWQNIFWGTSGRHVVTNHTTTVDKNRYDSRTVCGNVTRLGLKLLSLIEGEHHATPS